MKLNDFIASLFKKEKKFDNDIFEKLQPIAKRLKLRAQLEAHKDPKRRSGNLIKSISAPIKKINDNYVIQLNAGNSKVNYAKFVEYGTYRMYPRLFLARSRSIEEQKMPEELKRIAKLITSGLGYA